MTIIIFILVLVALIVVHEFGHFVVAKLSGMRVDEFGIGYPPRAWSWKRGETEYTLNWLPFGGFVRIYGEDGIDEGGKIVTDGKGRAFTDKNRFVQAVVLVAGIVMNLAFAWLLLSATLAIGTQRALAPEEIATTPDAALVVASVLPGSPGARAGLLPGDTIKDIEGAHGVFTGATADGFTSFISEEGEGSLLVLHVRGLDGKEREVSVVPREGVIQAHPERAAIGIAVATAGTAKVPLMSAPWEGLRLTWEITKETAVGLSNFFYSLATFSADLAQVSGPVGIAGAVGNASHQGITALLSLTAIISINLALINLVPIPALDGGRLLFVLIESIIRRPLPAYATRVVNTIGFGTLILLMLVVTANDVFKIFA
jgi:regulator of sigma E protease